MPFFPVTANAAVGYREARERSYVEFILRTEELNSAATTPARFVAVYDREKSGETKEQLNDAQTGYWSIVENLRSEHRRIELIGSPVFRHAAHRVNVEAQVKALFDLDGDDLLNQDAWQRWLDYDVDDIENERERLPGEAGSGERTDSPSPHGTMDSEGTPILDSQRPA